MKHKHHRSPDPEGSGGGTPEGGNEFANLPNLDNEKIEVNLNALAAPEGSFDGEIDVDTLPNLDEKMNKELGVKKTETPNVDDENIIQNNQKKPDNTQNKQPEGEVTEAMLMYAKLKSKYEDFDIPDNVENDDQFFEHVENFLASKKGITDIHPEAKKINDALKSGVNFDQFVKSYNQMTDVINMDSKALVSTHLKNTYKWDDNKVADYVNKMESSGILDFEAEKIRTEVTNHRNQMLENQQKQAQIDFETNQQKINIARQNAIKEVLTEFDKADNVFGVKVSQSEKAEFAKQFEYLVTPDSKTGISPLMAQLQSNETLAKVAYLLMKGDSAFRKAITDAKEGAKQEWRNKLDPEPKIHRNQGNEETGQIDLDALSAPARY